jgi:hypothetical protein
MMACVALPRLEFGGATFFELPVSWLAVQAVVGVFLAVILHHK